MQIVIILRKIVNTLLSQVRSVSIVQSLSIDIWQLNSQPRQTNKTKNGKLFFCKLFRFIKFVFLILLRKAFLKSKVAPTNRNSSAFLLHTSNNFSNVDLFSIFSQTFWELSFATKIKTMLLKQSAVMYTKKILRILFVWTLKILYTNKRILTWKKCLSEHSIILCYVLFYRQEQARSFIYKRWKRCKSTEDAVERSWVQDSALTSRKKIRHKYLFSPLKCLISDK